MYLYTFRGRHFILKIDVRLKLRRIVGLRNNRFSGALDMVLGLPEPRYFFGFELVYRSGLGTGQPDSLMMVFTDLEDGNQLAQGYYIRGKLLEPMQMGPIYRGFGELALLIHQIIMFLETPLKPLGWKAWLKLFWRDSELALARLSHPAGKELPNDVEWSCELLAHMIGHRNPPTLSIDDEGFRHWTYFRLGRLPQSAYTRIGWQNPILLETQCDVAS